MSVKSFSITPPPLGLSMFFVKRFQFLKSNILVEWSREHIFCEVISLMLTAYPTFMNVKIWARKLLTVSKNVYSLLEKCM